MLSHEEARRVYDRIGSLQDSQAFYEDRATDLLLAHGDFASAEAVFELGCGTGRLASRMLAELLPARATYRGVDVSPRMVALARERLAPWAPRAEVALVGGDPPTGEPTGSCDRFVSCYVLDLLSESDIRAVLAEAHRMLRRDGLLCLCSLSTGIGPISRAVSRGWAWVQARRPALVGGCRPIDLGPRLREAEWTIRFQQKGVAFGVTSETLIATPQPAAAEMLEADR